MLKTVCALKTGHRNCRLYVLCLSWIMLSIPLLHRSLQAEDAYPSQAIRIVTPLAAGSASDVIAVTAFSLRKLSERFGVPVIVPKKPTGRRRRGDRRARGNQFPAGRLQYCLGRKPTTPRSA